MRELALVAALLLCASSPRAEAPLEETRLPLRLIGTVVSASADRSLAVIESDLPDARKQQAMHDVERMRLKESPHASCVRSACKAYIDDPERMRKVFQAAREYLDSES